MLCTACKIWFCPACYGNESGSVLGSITCGPCRLKNMWTTHVPRPDAAEEQRTNYLRMSLRWAADSIWTLEQKWKPNTKDKYAGRRIA